MRWLIFWHRFVNNWVVKQLVNDSKATLIESWSWQAVTWSEPHIIRSTCRLLEHPCVFDRVMDG